MKQNHNPWQYASYELLIFDLDLQGQIANFITKWQILPLSCLGIHGSLVIFKFANQVPICITDHIARRVSRRRVTQGAEGF